MLPPALLSLFLLAAFLRPGSVGSLELRYHSNGEMEQYLNQTSASNPDITHLYSIGKSVKGRDLWVLALGVSPRQHTVGIPEFKYVGNMHGNEVVGRELLLHLIDHLLQGYRRNETWAVQLLRSARLHILPSMNPDGFEVASRECMFGPGRPNSNGMDLNRNFPDVFSNDQALSEEQREAEVRAVIRWLRSETFVLSANLHGGAVVASYPYDNGAAGGMLVSGASLTPDDDVFVHLAKEYSHNHASMHSGSVCEDSRPFLDGITNGYQWYPLAGGMQDYNYVWAQCLEVTLELSCCKYPAPEELPRMWEANKKALLAYMRQVHLGVKGRVLDGSGQPAVNAVVEVEGRRNICPFKTNQQGEYYRLLLPGTYSFTVTLSGHQVLTETLHIPYGPDSYSALKHDFRLQRSPSSTASRTQVSPTPSCDYPTAPGGGSTAVRPTWTRQVTGVLFPLLLLLTLSD